MMIRTAIRDDAPAMSKVLEAIIAVTGHTRPSSTEFVLANYIANPNGILCSVAENADREILGFQSLIRAVPDNRYGVAAGWGIIGTHISPLAARQGVGARLFAVTKIAAQKAGIDHIDATIGAQNSGGLAYYEAMGFRTYRTGENTICKCFSVLSPHPVT